MNDIIIITISSLSSIIAVSIPAYLIHKRENNKLKNEIKEHQLRGDVLDKILDLTLLSTIKDSVSALFHLTKADRFLILIAVNGKVEFRTISVIFEQHRNSTSSSIAAYKSLRVDSDYVEMLKSAERYKFVLLNVAKMKPSLLKTIYEEEGVKYSGITHMNRITLDKDNDCLIYASAATHNRNPFTVMELARIQSHIDGTIKPAIEKMLL